MAIAISSPIDLRLMLETTARQNTSQTLLPTPANFVICSLGPTQAFIITWQEVTRKTSNKVKIFLSESTWSLCAGALSSPEDLKSYISKDDLSGQHTCVICNYANRNAGNVRNHVESRHFPNMFEYTCKLCGDVFGTKTQLNNHLARSHKKLHM